MQSFERVTIEVVWRVLERRAGLWVPIYEFHNLITSSGLTALAGAPSGTYVAPIYLVIDTAYTTLSSTYAPGATSIQLVGDPTIGGDTKLDLSVGQAGQETVTFTAKSGTGPYTFTLSPATANTHTLGDFAVRTPTTADLMSSVLSEASYDPTYAPGLRLPVTANYSPASGQNTMQFFIAGIQATNVFFAHVGLADSKSIGAGSLHNYASLGYNHNTTNDTEFDITYALTSP